MKVIHEKDYIYLGIQGKWHAFESNPDKKGFDKEMILIERARYVNKDGKSKLLALVD